VVELGTSSFAMLVLSSIGENNGGGNEWNGSSNHRDEPL